MRQFDYSRFTTRHQAEDFLQRRYERSLILLVLSQILVDVGLFPIGARNWYFYVFAAVFLADLFALVLINLNNDKKRAAVRTHFRLPVDCPE